MVRSSHPQVFLEKGVLKICSKFTGEHPCQSAISIKLQSNSLEIALRHGCSPVNLLVIFRRPIPKTITGRLLLNIDLKWVSVAEAVVQKCSVKNCVFKILQNLHENSWARVSLLIKL